MFTVAEFIGLSILAGILINIVTDIYRLIGRKIVERRRPAPNNVYAIA